MGCIFCKIVDGKLPCHKVWEDDKFLAFLDINPIKPGHTLLIPKTHIDYLFDMDKNFYTDIFFTVRQVSEKIQKATSAKRIGVAVEGFSVPHVHIHLVPVNSANELNPLNAKTAEAKGLEVMAKKIRAV